MKIILASASQRRQELLGRITKDFEIIISDFDESKEAFFGDCAEYVMNLAEGKALSVKNKFTKEDAVIIGCDTIVYLNKTVLGKPKDKNEAKEMLQSLSGNTHEVYSGIAIVNTYDGRVLKSFERTEVKFSKLNSRDIEKYIETGEPMDKAGAYGIQGYGGVFIESINGCFYNVVGLPLNKLKVMLGEMGISL